MRRAPPRSIEGLEGNMLRVRPIAVRVLRYVFNRWLKEAAKIHHL